MNAMPVYEIGKFVETVARADVSLSVPLPLHWHILRVVPGRDSLVIRAMYRRGYSGYSLTVSRSFDRNTGLEARRPHLGKLIVKAFLPGLIFIPDFELARISEIQDLENVDGLFRVGPSLPKLKNSDIRMLHMLSGAQSLPLGQRKYAVAQLVRLVDGPFAGFVGKIERLDSHGRLKVFIDTVMRGASVAVTEAQIEPVLARSRARMVRRRADRL